jgi:hypothetical protein
MIIMVEEPLLCDEWYRANKRQLEGIGRLIRENRKYVVEIGNGDPNPFYWRAAQEYATGILNMLWYVPLACEWSAIYPFFPHLQVEEASVRLAYFLRHYNSNPARDLQPLPSILWFPHPITSLDDAACRRGGHVGPSARHGIEAD